MDFPNNDDDEKFACETQYERFYVPLFRFGSCTVVVVELYLAERCRLKSGSQWNDMHVPSTGWYTVFPGSVIYEIVMIFNILGKYGPRGSMAACVDAKIILA